MQRGTVFSYFYRFFANLQNNKQKQKNVIFRTIFLRKTLKRKIKTEKNHVSVMKEFSFTAQKERKDHV